MTKFKSTQDRIDETIDTINSKLTNHKIKLKHSRPYKYIISKQGNSTNRTI